eukprot:TRINITY_DN15657_c0_g2_i2.p1 TRINITY_DN15657_c0_g2~~TRINITY_DN15657_c0_g2_i2.p1  ORF type:complete len:149 (+),score=47.08 TRINITY_DN15657_c0_g2_i2:36-449(+)
MADKDEHDEDEEVQRKKKKKKGMADKDEHDEDEEVQRKKKDRPVRRVTVRDTDMLPDLQAEVIEYIEQGLDDFKLSKDIARHVKQRLDESTKEVWHVIVGSHFACNTTHDAGTLLNVTVDTVTALVFRNGPPMKSEG